MYYLTRSTGRKYASPPLSLSAAISTFFWKKFNCKCTHKVSRPHHNEYLHKIIGTDALGGLMELWQKGTVITEHAMF